SDGCGSGSTARACDGCCSSRCATRAARCGSPDLDPRRGVPSHDAVRRPPRDRRRCPRGRGRRGPPAHAGRAAKEGGGGARAARAFGVAPDVVPTSPLVGAVETARIVVAGLRDAPEPRELAGLAWDVTAADTLKALRAFGRNRHVMIVGHEPNLSNVLALL